MKQIAIYNKPFVAYRINDENDLDELLVDEFGEYTSIYKIGNKIRIRNEGDPIVFEFGDWVIITNDEIKTTYTNDEFNKYFTIVV